MMNAICIIEVHDSLLEIVYRIINVHTIEIYSIFDIICKCHLSIEYYMCAYNMCIQIGLIALSSSTIETAFFENRP